MAFNLNWLAWKPEDGEFVWERATGQVYLLGPRQDLGRAHKAMNMTTGIGGLYISVSSLQRGFRPAFDGEEPDLSEVWRRQPSMQEEMGMIAYTVQRDLHDKKVQGYIDQMQAAMVKQAAGGIPPYPPIPSRA